MKNLIKHFRRWNIWRKRNLNGRLYKILVLFGITKSPTMATVLLPEEIGKWADKTVTSQQIIDELRELFGKEEEQK